MQEWKAIFDNTDAFRSWVRHRSDMDLIVTKRASRWRTYNALVRDAAGRTLVAKAGFWALRAAQRWAERQYLHYRYG